MILPSRIELEKRIIIGAFLTGVSVEELAKYFKLKFKQIETILRQYIKDT